MMMTAKILLSVALALIIMMVSAQAGFNPHVIYKGLSQIGFFVGAWVIILVLVCWFTPREK